jgi:hypothetical protein
MVLSKNVRGEVQVVQPAENTLTTTETRSPQGLEQRKMPESYRPQVLIWRLQT